MWVSASLAGCASPSSAPAALCAQEKALLALVQLLQHHGAEIGGSTLEGAAATLRALGARLQASLAADSEDLFAGDVLAVVRQVQELVAAEAERRKRVEL